MRTFIILSFLFLTFIPLKVTAVSTKCESALQALFSEGVSREEAAKFLQLQGNITLHRLAWTFLRAQKNDNDQKVQSIERTILELLNEKYTNADPEFIKAREAYEAQPLSRTTLADIAPYLKEALAEDYEERDQNFKINTSDLKLLGAVAKYERANLRNGKYDHRMLSSQSPESILNFVKLINSSYKLSPNQEEDQLSIEFKLTGLENVMNGLQKELSSFLDKLSIPTECYSENGCNAETSMSTLFSQNDEVQKIFWSSLSEDLESDDLLMEKLSYGDLWLQVKAERNSEVQTENRPELKSASPQVFNSNGLIIADPVSIILKDRTGRKKESWQTFERGYLEAMAEAILENDNVFQYNDKLFDRKTGREVTPEEALRVLPPKAREEAKIKMYTTVPELRLPHAMALANKELTFIRDDKIYDLNGNELNPAVIIAETMTTKTGLTVSPDRYEGMGKDYLVSRAHSLKNNKPYFKVDNRTFDSLSGRDISSPFRSLASEDTKIDKTLRRMYENLPDADLIRNFHRENPNPDCEYFGIIDKKQASIKIYSNKGNEIYSTEVLVGAEASDKRTRWTEYSSTVRTPSSSTGAGVFTIRPQNLNDTYNKNNFNNNILSFKDEKDQDTVFAIHQVPVNLNSRYSRFGTNDPEDRRVSGGCVNVKLSDFQAMTKWLGPQCKVYVLPEEEGNKFIVRDNELKFVSSEPIPMNQTNLYNFSPIDFDAQPIDIKIVNESGNTRSAREFVKALEDEKAKLMKMYKLSNDEYNDLAMLAYGILGNESDFGKSVKLAIKENNQLEVMVARLIKTRSFKEAGNTSRGLTQIKFLPEGVFTENYPEVNKNNLTNPRNSAVATMAYLAEAAKQMRVIATRNKSDPSKLRITRENMMDFMGYLYQGGRRSLTTSDVSQQATPEFNGYYRSLQRHMSYIEISQKML